MNEISAFVLAGGKSSRMGTDKAFLKLGGTTLLQRALSLVLAVTNDVFVVGEKSRLPGIRTVIGDIHSGCGPLAGIHAALSHSPTDLNLLMAVDLPFITESFLRYLISISQQSDAVVVIPRSGGRLQPLCAIYRKAFAEPAAQALKQGKYKIDPLFSQASTRMIEETELADAGFSCELFKNVNTPADWDEAQRRLSQNV